MVSASLALVIALVALALIFDFLNGVHDAANSIATVVSTRVLSPHAAVVWAACFNFIAFLFFGLHVAQTMGTGLISANVVGLTRGVRRAHGRHHMESHNVVGRTAVL